MPTIAPSNVQAEAVNSTTIRFTWAAPNPQFINGINQGYKVRGWGCHEREMLGGGRVVGGDWSAWRARVGVTSSLAEGWRPALAWSIPPRALCLPPVSELIPPSSPGVLC